MDSLLPPPASGLERSLEAATVRAGALPPLNRHVWDPDRCPEALLPWLAWAVSVDLWRDDWPADRKRAAIKASIAWHRVKGTPGGLRRAIAEQGYPDVRIDDCVGVYHHDGNHRYDATIAHTGGRLPYRFEVIFPAEPAAAIDRAEADWLLTVIAAGKNARSHLCHVRDGGGAYVWGFYNYHDGYCPRDGRYRYDGRRW